MKDPQNHHRMILGQLVDNYVRKAGNDPLPRSWRKTPAASKWKIAQHFSGSFDTTANTEGGAGIALSDIILNGLKLSSRSEREAKR